MDRLDQRAEGLRRRLLPRPHHQDRAHLADQPAARRAPRLHRRDVVGHRARAGLPDVAGSAAPGADPVQHPAAGASLGRTPERVRGFDWSIAASSPIFATRCCTTASDSSPIRRSPIRCSAAMATPPGSATTYALQPGGQQRRLESASRGLPISSTRGGALLRGRPSGTTRHFLQTPSPASLPEHPYRDQSKLPNFTTAETDFNFQRIFAENRFVGGDRIGDANQLTIALTSRLIESSTGLERFKVGLGQVYYFTPPRVTLARRAANKYSTSSVSPRARCRVGFDGRGRAVHARISRARRGHPERRVTPPSREAS